MSKLKQLLFSLNDTDRKIIEEKLKEKDKEIKDLKERQDWYSMWHKQFKKQIEDLTTELETYRPTKLHGNGQCECYKCKIECRQPIHWTDWCSKYKGHIYCDDCLKEILKEEEKPKTPDQEIDQLKQQLSEKDKEIERLKISNDNLVDFYLEQVFILDEDYNKDLEERLQEIRELEEKQTQFVIQKLEKIKESIKSRESVITENNSVDKDLKNGIKILKYVREQIIEKEIEELKKK